jgi:hypothetical protein
VNGKLTANIFQITIYRQNIAFIRDFTKNLSKTQIYEEV